MTQQLFANETYSLDHGLTLRWSTAEDTEKIANLMGIVWRGSDENPPNPRVMDQIRLHMRGDFPWMTPTDFALVEDTQNPNKPIVACGALWRKEWNYGEIPFAVGQPESIATHPAYRRRGLVRTMMKLLHSRSKADGQLVQMIAGIPNFYRQFGYEYAIDMGGKRTVYLPLIPKADGQSVEPYRLRPAQVADISLMAALRQRRQPADGVWWLIPEQAWRYSITTWEEIENGRVDAAASGVHERLLIIEDEAGQSCGYLQANTKRWGVDLPVHAIEFVEGINVHAAMPSLLRALAAYGEQLPVVASDSEPLREIAFSLGRTHPIYEALGESLAPVYERPYAWYVRVPDLPAFLQHIAPVLERRLASSILAGYTGELRITFYQDGLQLKFEQGTVTTVESRQPLQATQPASAAFPALVFLQLLFGYRSLEDLCSIFPDARVHDESQVLLDVLFPTKN